MAKKAAQKTPARKPPARKTAAKKPPAPALDHIAADLRPLATPIADLQPDPANARRHGQRNLDTIAASLARFGQVKPVVALADGTVIAGNGTIAAAKSLGWEHVAVTRFADAEAARAFALADNRTAELAEWDVALLEEQLAELADLDIDIEGLGFDAGEIAALTAGIDAETSEPSPAAGKSKTKEKTGADQTDQLPDGYRILIDCADEAEQMELLERFSEEGLSCRALTA